MIREKRLNMKMTQKELARKLRVDKSYISKIENKQISNISLNLVFRICNILEIDILDFINFIKNE